MLYSQLTKGNWLVGGDGSFNRQKTFRDNNIFNVNDFRLISTDLATYTFKLNPNIGYFFLNKIVIGAKFELSISKTENKDIKIKDSQLNSGVFARYYFLKQDNRVNLFVEPSMSFYTYIFLPKTTFYNMKIGTVIFFNETAGFEVALSYQNAYNNLGYTSNILLNLGFQIHLSKN